MKILQVATLVSPDGAYGGPIRVATNHFRELQRLGHDVTLVAAGRGFGKNLPTEFDGVPIKLFPGHQLIPGTGFAGLFSPRMLTWLLKHSKDFDILHIHLARDLVTLPIASLANFIGKTYVVQTHGMIDTSPKKLAAILDLVATRRILAKAARVFFLTPEEKQALKEVSSTELNLEFLPNGVPRADASNPPNKMEKILYLARLQARKRPELFVEMAARLHPEFPQIQFVMIGPDEGSGEKVTRAIKDGNAESFVTWDGPISPEKTLQELREAYLYVLPSVNEPFPMSVLEAMSVGTPSVVSKSCGLAPFIIGKAGVVFDESVEDMVIKIRELLTQPEEHSRLSQGSLELVRDQFDMQTICGQLIESYGQAVGASK